MPCDEARRSRDKSVSPRRRLTASVRHRERRGSWWVAAVARVGAGQEAVGDAVAVARWDRRRDKRPRKSRWQSQQVEAARLRHFLAQIKSSRSVTSGVQLTLFQRQAFEGAQLRRVRVQISVKSADRFRCRGTGSRSLCRVSGASIAGAGRAHSLARLANRLIKRASRQAIWR